MKINENKLGFHHCSQIIDTVPLIKEYDFHYCIVYCNTQKYFYFLFTGVNIPLCSQKIVYNSAEYLLEVLEREICKNHDPGSHILAKIILLVYDLRAYEHHQDKAIDNFVQDALEVGVAEYLVALYDCVHR